MRRASTSRFISLRLATAYEAALCFQRSGRRAIVLGKRALCLIARPIMFAHKHEAQSATNGRQDFVKCEMADTRS
jgi:hypothetical protein